MTAPTALGQSVVVTVDGSPVPEALAELLESVVVDLAVGLPASAVLRYRDPARATETARVPLSVGKAVRISTNAVGEPKIVPVFEGEVTSTEYEWDGTGAVVVVRCHDALHRLTRGTRTRTFLDVKASDVVRRVLGDAGVAAGEITATKVVHPHLPQVASSDWDFLSGLAREAGLVLVGALGKACLVPLAAPGAALRMTVGHDIARLRVRLSSAGQVRQVQVRGWDPTTKKAVVGTTAPREQAGSALAAPAKLASSFAPPPRGAGDGVVAVTAHAQQRADAVAARLADLRADLEATCTGNPLLAPRTKLEVVGADADHDGVYVLTRVQHLFDAEGYRTRVESSGAEDRGLRALAGGSGSAASRGRVPGVANGIVTNIKDVDGGARVKVKLPWLSDDYETDWLRVCTPGAGPQRGLTWLPDVNDEVLVAFDQGDPRRAYVLGGLWNGKDKPPQGNDANDGKGAHTRRGLRSAKGSQLLMSDDQAAVSVSLATPGKNELLLDDTGKRLKVVMPHSGGTITVESNGKVVMTGAQDVEVRSTTGRLVLEGKTGVEIKGLEVKINGTAQVAVTGGVIKLN